MKNREDLSLERLILFSDAVMAIAITLLVLDLRLPETANTPLKAQLWGLSSRYLSFVISFAVIGLFWEAHHRLFSYVDRYDRRLLWLNLLFLLFVVFLPFPTSVLGSHWSATAIVFYTGSVGVTGIARALLWTYAVGHDLTSDDLTPAMARSELWRGWAVPGVFAISLIVAIFSPPLAPIVWILLGPVSIIGRHAAQRASSN